MKNKLIDLNNHLFEELERLNDDEIVEKNAEREFLRAKAICGIASQIIQNGNLILNAQKHSDEYGVKAKDLFLIGPGSNENMD